MVESTEKISLKFDEILPAHILRALDESKKEEIDPKEAQEQYKIKAIAFNEWCEQNGVEQPGCEYPAYFDNGLVGVRALAPIKHRQAFCKVPFRCIMSLDKAINDPVLGKIIKGNRDILS